MPGVPTFLGCDACFKQKKKCEKTQIGPTKCSRCARLGETCEGGGQRYKFKQENPAFFLAKTPRSKKPLVLPNNQVTRLAGRFASALQIDNPQFDLKCFGGWFADIPARTGACELLDHATDVFLAAHDDLRSGQKSPRTIEKCGKVINLLHNTLHDTEQSKSPYTLCAIFMLMVAQMWALESAHMYMCHMQGICTLLNFTIDEPWRDTFGQDLRYHLIVPACIEAIINPNMTQIDFRYLEVLNTRLGCYRPLDKEEGQAIESLDLPYLMRFSHFTRQPEMYQDKMIIEYARMKIECPFVRRRLTELTNMANVARAARKTNNALIRAQIQMGVAYTMILSFTLLINTFISAMDPANKSLEEEALHFAREAVWITRISSKQLPVGAGFMPAALFAAWVATDDKEVNDDFELTKNRHKTYWAEPEYVLHFETLKERARVIRNRRLEELRTGGLQGMNVTDFTTTDGLEYSPWERGGPLIDVMLIDDGNPGAMSISSCELELVDCHNWDPSFAASYV